MYTPSDGSYIGGQSRRKKPHIPRTTTMEKVEQVHEELGDGVDEKVLATGVREARSYDTKFMQRTRYKVCAGRPNL